MTTTCKTVVPLPPLASYALTGVTWPSTLKRLYLTNYGLDNSTGKVPSGCEVTVTKFILDPDEIEARMLERANREEELRLLDGYWDDGDLTDSEGDWSGDVGSDFSM